MARASAACSVLADDAADVVFAQQGRVEAVCRPAMRYSAALHAIAAGSVALGRPMLA